MPKRTDIRKIVIIGSGPIIIGQACEFDYSGTQACKALREEGYEVILLNSNPATIMTDPDVADRTYNEPITVDSLTQICHAERPDAILPTLGGQTGLNIAFDFAQTGLLEELDIQMIGADAAVIEKAESREHFKAAMHRCGLDMPEGAFARNMEQAWQVLDRIGTPCIVRPSFTLGGTGSGKAYNRDEFEQIASLGIELSPASEILIEESVEGWKEFELEVMRDRNDNVVIVCSIENLDPMGVHTGDSITVAPAQTLTDKEYQRMRDAAIRCIREIGVETGGSNIQFAIDPGTGRMVVIEMNPRVSRSSALASKATGFPIARIAAKLAVGYTLDELPNDITRETPACFEPTIDYVVVKVPRFAFEKFPEASPVLTTQMKSVGEVMAIGRTFKESLQKALAGLEIGRHGLGCDPKGLAKEADEEKMSLAYVRRKLAFQYATPNRIFYLRHALRMGMGVGEVSELSRIDPWFIDQIGQLVAFEARMREAGSLASMPAALLREAKTLGYSDVQIATATGAAADEVRARRARDGLAVTFKLVDTCAAEFEAYTPYFYSTYESEDEVRFSDKPKIMILGGGPNRIGQGIEFDYCCVHASFALREMGFETIMVNSNPETVSTDFDTSDLLFFEPLTHEHVLQIWERLRPEGVIVQFGGQTPLNLARGLLDAGVKILGTPVESIERAEDREQFNALIRTLGLSQPDGGIARNLDEARAAAARVGYPVLVRPSFVLGGRAMLIVGSERELERFFAEAMAASEDRPVLIDQFLTDAIEVDVDCIADGERVVIGGIMEHIEMAGVHSGDSACALPPHSLPGAVIDEIRATTCQLAVALGVRGLMNAQYAVKGGKVWVLEVNPRASRTVPFVSKAIGRPLAKYAAMVMAGRPLAEIGFTEEVVPGHVAVKEAVLPFAKFPGCDILLGPEMKSTGEVMGIDTEFGRAFAKAQIAAGNALPSEGTIFLSVNDADKPAAAGVARKLAACGFTFLTTQGTGEVLRNAGVEAEVLPKIQSGLRPNILDKMKNGDVALVINTPTRRGANTDEARIRRETVLQKIPCITTITGAAAAAEGIRAQRESGLRVRALQDYHAQPV